MTETARKSCHHGVARAARATFKTWHDLGRKTFENDDPVRASSSFILSADGHTSVRDLAGH